MLYQLGKVSDAILQLQVRTMRTRELLASSTAAHSAACAAAVQPCSHKAATPCLPPPLPAGPGSVAERLCRSARRPGIDTVCGAAGAAGSGGAAVGAWP